MSSGESFIEIKIDKNGQYQVFGPNGTKLKLLNPDEVNDILKNSRGINCKFSNEMATYLETGSGIIWINGKPYYVP